MWHPEKCNNFVALFLVCPIIVLIVVSSAAEHYSSYLGFLALSENYLSLTMRVYLNVI